jgi:large subunit ribosomal protein L17
MRHHNTLKKFGRVRKVRTALIKSLALSLVLNNKIKTTETKAKALRPVVEKMITNGKSATLASRRLLISRVGKEGAEKIVKEISPKYADRKGGYLRITKLPSRKSDGGSMAVIEFI